MPVAPFKQAPTRSIFISYSHKDYEDVGVLLKWLKPLCKSMPGYQLWADSEQLKGGDRWDEAIATAIEQASVFLVVMSIDYVNSEFCLSHELSRILARHREGQAKVVGIALRKVAKLSDVGCPGDDGAWHSMATLQCLPQSAVKLDQDDKYGLRWIASWQKLDRDAPWSTLTEQIEKALLSDRHAPQDRPDLPGISAHAPTSLVSKNIEASPAPTLLPYLADRQDQTYQLADALQRWEADGFTRPLVVLTDGRPQDCLSKWVERMHVHEFDAALRIEADGLSFGHFKPFGWPSSARPLSAAIDAHRHFERALAECLGPRPVSPLKEVTGSYLQRSRPTLLWTQCSERAASAHATTALLGLIELLARWPTLNRQSMLVLALNIERQSGAPWDTPSALGAEFETHLRAAEAGGQVTLAALGALPELDLWTIQQWAQQHATSSLVDDIDKLCSQHLPADRDTWPMRDFAAKAREWLNGAADAR